MLNCNFRESIISSQSVFVFEQSISRLLANIAHTRLIPKATILVYHSVSSNIDKSNLPTDSVSSEAFEKQIRFLRERSFKVISLKDLVYYLKEGEEIPEKSVVITFDDGYKNTFSNAYPILEKYKMPATVFLAAGYIGSKGLFPWLESFRGSSCFEDLSPMNWEEVIELHNSNIEIGSHTFYHKFLPRINRNEIEEEVLKSQSVIAEKIGTIARSFALPFSFPIKHRSWPTFRKVLLEALEKGGYTSCCTMLRGHITLKSPPFFLKRIPVVKYDNLKSFRAKLLGCYTWTRIPQYIFQALFKKY